MKITFTSEEDKGLGSVLAHHFGTYLHHVFVEVENDKNERVSLWKRFFEVP